MSRAAGAGWQQTQNGTTARAGAAPAASPQVPGGLAGARQTDGSKTAREALRFLFSPGEDCVSRQLPCCLSMLCDADMSRLAWKCIWHVQAGMRLHLEQLLTCS